MSSMPSQSLTPRAAFELDRRAAKRAAAEKSGPMGVIGSPVGRPARVLASLQRAVARYDDGAPPAEHPERSPAPAPLRLVEPAPTVAAILSTLGPAGESSFAVIGTAPPKGDEPAPADPWHVRGAPEGSVPYGVTYDGGARAFDALNGAVSRWEIKPEHVRDGTVALTRGPWPSRRWSVASVLYLGHPSGPPSVARPVEWSVGSPVYGNDPTSLAVIDAHAALDGAVVRVRVADGPDGIVLRGRDERGVAAVTQRSHAGPPVIPVPEPGPGETITVGDGGRYAFVRRADPPAPVEPPPVEPPPVATFTTRAETVSAVAVERITGDRALLAACGIVQPPPVRPLGGVINEVGKENLSRSHAAWSAMPTTIDACRTLVGIVREEDRCDVSAERRPLVLLPNGNIRHPNGGEDLAIEDAAWSSLVALHRDSMPSADRLLRRISADDRARLWNQYTAGDVRYTDADARSLVLRTRAADGGGRAIYGVVSDGYSAFDADRIADLAERALRMVHGGTSARGEVTYDPSASTLTIDATWHAQGVHDFGAGDVITGGIRITGQDTGGGAIRVYPTAWFNLCYNLIITATRNGDVTRIVHRGDQTAMAQRLADAIRHAGDAFRPFVERWGHARAASVVDLFDKASADPALNLRAVFRAIAGAAPDPELPELAPLALRKVDGLDWSGVERDALVESLMLAHRGQPGNQRSSDDGQSIADVLSAVTRLHADTRIPIPVLARAEQHANTLLLAWS